MLFKEDTLARSQVFEWTLANQLQAEFFWRNSSKDEVDFILTDEDSPEEVIPVEAKYGKVETEGIEKFMDKYNVEEGWILTKDKETEIEREEQNYTRHACIQVPSKGKQIQKIVIVSKGSGPFTELRKTNMFLDNSSAQTLQIMSNTTDIK